MESLNTTKYQKMPDIRHSLAALGYGLENIDRDRAKPSKRHRQNIMSAGYCKRWSVEERVAHQKMPDIRHSLAALGYGLENIDRDRAKPSKRQLLGYRKHS